MKSQPRHAFTLIELLAVIAIVGVLTAITIPVLSSVRESASAARCGGNLRQLAAAGLLWVNDNGGRMPDARAWSYNEGVSNAAHLYQLNNYLNIRLAKNADWSRYESPMQCAAAAAERPPSVATHFGRTYAINTYATSTIHENGGFTQQRESAGYPQRINQIPKPSRLAFFMDGAVADGSGNYAANVNQSHVRSTASSPIRYVHGDAINVAYVDGHISRISRADMEASNATGDTPFWKFNQ